jgi:hypothetical protein
MDQPSTRNGSNNQQLLSTTTSIASLSSQTVQHQRLILKPPPSYIVLSHLLLFHLLVVCGVFGHTGVDCQLGNAIEGVEQMNYAQYNQGMRKSQIFTKLLKIPIDK